MDLSYEHLWIATLNIYICNMYMVYAFYMGIFQDCLPRFDIFWHPDFLECLGDIAKTYSELASVVLNGLPKCRINDLFFETDEQALRLEMKRQSSSASEGQIGGERQ